MGSVLTEMWRRLRSIWSSFRWTRPENEVTGEAMPQGGVKVGDEAGTASSQGEQDDAAAGAEEVDEGGCQSGEEPAGDVRPAEPEGVSGERGAETPDSGGAAPPDDGGVPGPVEDVDEQWNEDGFAEREDAPGADEGAERRRGPRRRKPVSRGGARREPRKETREDGAAGRTLRRSRVARARIVCRRNAGSWRIAVTPAAGVVVRGESDEQSVVAGGEFTPAEFRSVALIEDERGGRSERVPLYVDEPMVFRLGADWQGEGREVGGVGIGHFIVIAPAGWKRLGDVPVEPEACVDSEYRAHYFFGSRGDGQPVEGFEERGVSSSVIVLNGDRVFDDSDRGELFVGEPPVLKAPGMALARVGEEGKEGWGETFGLDDGRSLADVLGGREGWFFVRVYREGVGVEADSVHFRYMPSLREIRIEGEVYDADTLLVPGPRGHASVDVEIVGDRRAASIAGVTVDGSLELERDGGRIQCPADPAATELEIRVEGERGVVDVVVGMPRVWWRLSVPGETPGQWLDRAPRMTRDEYRTLGLAGAEIWIDVPDRVRRVGVGFGDQGATNYPATKSGQRRGCVVPLGHFVYHAEVDQRLFQDAALSAYFAEAVVELVEIAADALPRIVEFTVGRSRVSPDDTVAVRWRAEECEGVAVSLGPDVGQVGSEGSREIRVEDSTTVTLTLSAAGMEDVVEGRLIEVVRPDVVRGSELVPRAKAAELWRRAKGFSLREVSAVRGAEGLAIRVDRRRRSKHAVNVAALERCMNEQR